MSEQTVLDYIALKPCGCMAMWMSGRIPTKDLAKGVAKAIREGLEVQRCTTEDARKWPMKCGKCMVF